MANTQPPPPQQLNDPRLYCQLGRLRQLKAQSPLLQLPPYTEGQMSGRHLSRVRGRGLNFEEMRHYRQGDDIRQLDWKVTMRTGKPHVRTYSEEKERSVVVCVDQRSSMFFASVDTLKSVVAAELAALVAWRALADNDRVSVMVQTDDGVVAPPPRRSEAQLLQQLQQLSLANQRLTATSDGSQRSNLGQLLQEIRGVESHGALIVLITDWHLASAAELEQLKRLQQRHFVMLVMVNDPLEWGQNHNAQRVSSWLVGDGRHQLTVQSQQQLQLAAAGLRQLQQQKLEHLTPVFAARRWPILQVDTSGDHIQQLLRGLQGAM